MATEQITTQIIDGEDDPEPTEIELKDDAEFKIEVIDDTPEADKGKEPRRGDAQIPDDSELEDYSESVQKRIKKLRFEFHEERRAKETAQRQNDEAIRIAQELVNENTSLKNNLSNHQNAYVEQSSAKADAEITQAKTIYKQAYETGDAEAMVDAQEQLGHAVADKNRLDQYVPRQQEQQQQFKQPQSQDPTQTGDPKAQEWFRENPWFGEDKLMTGFVYGLHEKLISEDGLNPTSDEYYKLIDGGMRNHFPEYFDGAEEEVHVRETKSVVAPATRTGSRARTVRLTQTQVDVARRLGVPLEQYAKELLKEGQVQ